MNNPHFTMPKVRVLVADASKARFFRVDSPQGELIEISTDVNPEGRMHNGDLTTDRPGRQADSMNSGRSAMEEPNEPKDVEAQRFAKQIAEKLEKSRTSGEMEKLYMVAPPKFMGELRKHLKHDVKSLIVEEINKDLSGQDAKSLRKHLPERLK